MGVPAHDQRDFDFARKFGLEVRVVIQPEGSELLDGASMPTAVPAQGAMVNSGLLSGTPAGKTIPRAVEYIEDKKVGKRAVTYRIRDWLISRQRYWGAPIPIRYSAKIAAKLQSLTINCRFCYRMMWHGNRQAKARSNSTRPGDSPNARSAAGMPNAKLTRWIHSCVIRGTTCDI